MCVSVPCRARRQAQACGSLCSGLTAPRGMVLRFFFAGLRPLGGCHVWSLLSFLSFVCLGACRASCPAVLASSGRRVVVGVVGFRLSLFFLAVVAARPSAPGLSPCWLVGLFAAWAWWLVFSSRCVRCCAVSLVVGASCSACIFLLVFFFPLAITK